jgi:hypothetical protein
MTPTITVDVDQTVRRTLCPAVTGLWIQPSGPRRVTTGGH